MSRNLVELVRRRHALDALPTALDVLKEASTSAAS